MVTASNAPLSVTVSVVNSTSLLSMEKKGNAHI